MRRRAGAQFIHTDCRRARRSPGTASHTVDTKEEAVVEIIVFGVSKIASSVFEEERHSIVGHGEVLWAKSTVREKGDRRRTGLERWERLAKLQSRRCIYTTKK